MNLGRGEGFFDTGGNTKWKTTFVILEQYWFLFYGGHDKETGKDMLNNKIKISKFWILFSACLLRSYLSRGSWGGG